jgi:hypothetical protein
MALFLVLFIFPALFQAQLSKPAYALAFISFAGFAPKSVL